MISTLIIFGIFILTAVTGGFFMGYYKREDKLPDIPSVKEVITAMLPDKPEKMSRAEERELEKANEFFN